MGGTPVWTVWTEFPPSRRHRTVWTRLGQDWGRSSSLEPLAGHDLDRRRLRSVDMGPTPLLHVSSLHPGL